MSFCIFMIYKIDGENQHQNYGCISDKGIQSFKKSKHFVSSSSTTFAKTFLTEANILLRLIHAQ